MKVANFVAVLKMVDVQVFHTVLVNEVQIELGNESEYIDLINELQTKVDAGTATEEEEKQVLLIISFCQHHHVFYKQ